jgi:outer membrane protein
VLNAQQQFYTAKRDLLQARYNYLISSVRLKYASGLLTETDLGEVNQQLIAKN